MDNISEDLKDLFVSEVRLKILKLMLTQPEEQYHVRAIVRAVDAEINAVRRELAKLESMGLLSNRQSGNRLYYKADTAHIYYRELLALVTKEDGVGGLIMKNIKDLGTIKFAVLSTAFLRGRKSTVLDVDLFIVGDVNLEVLKRVVAMGEREMSREVNYSVMSEEDFMFRKRKNDHFVSKILSQSRTMLIGDEEEFCAVI
jgi:DNA-binding transcriptional ArsR family regulator